MSVRDWSKTTADYTRKLVHSGYEGAALGAESALHGADLSSFFIESVRTALVPAALGACLGVLRCHPATRKSAARALAYGFLGGAVGFSCAVAWHTRQLASSAGSGAWQSVSHTRDEHWLEQHPIDYA